jgi:hypothetical protein
LIEWAMVVVVVVGLFLWQGLWSLWQLWILPWPWALWAPGVGNP